MYLKILIREEMNIFMLIVNMFIQISKNAQILQKPNQKNEQ